MRFARYALIACAVLAAEGGLFAPRSWPPVLPLCKAVVAKGRGLLQREPPPSPPAPEVIEDREYERVGEWAQSLARFEREYGYFPRKSERLEYEMDGRILRADAGPPETIIVRGCYGDLLHVLRSQWHSPCAPRRLVLRGELAVEVDWCEGHERHVAIVRERGGPVTIVRSSRR